MTVAELEANMSAKEGYIFTDELILGIDISEGQNCAAADYTAVQSGLTELSADFSPRTVMRKYVDGDRCIPLSEMRSFTLRFLMIKADPVQRFLINASVSSSPVRYVFKNIGDGTSYTGNALAGLSSAPSGKFPAGMITVTLTKC